MLIANIKTKELDMYGSLFPDTAIGPNINRMLNLNGWAQVLSVIEHDPEKERLITCEPYFMPPFVYTVKTEELTPAEKLTKARTSMVVTMRQARRAMLSAGVLSSVEVALNAIVDDTERQEALIEWEYATEMKRDYPWVQMMASQLGMDEEQLDNLFILAATF